MTFQIKPIEKQLLMVLFVLYIVLTFEFVDEILRCYHSIETFSALVRHGAICFVCSSYF